MVDSPLGAALKARPLLLDAGMGTRLIARGLDPARENSASWSLTHPAEVAAIHRADIAAGADAIVTNTFQASPRTLKGAGLLSRFEAINHRAVELARAAAGPDRFVLGTLAPDEAGRGTIEQAALLADLGVDALLMETWEAPYLAKVAERLRSFLDLPLLGSVHRWDPSVDRAVLDRLTRNLDGFGMNCLPPRRATARLREIAAGCPAGYPLFVKPSGAGPTLPDDPPEVFAAEVGAWLGLGVRLVGGCCGATDAHLAAMRRALDAAGTA